MTNCQNALWSAWKVEAFYHLLLLHCLSPSHILFTFSWRSVTRLIYVQLLSDCSCVAIQNHIKHIISLLRVNWYKWRELQRGFMSRWKKLAMFASFVLTQYHCSDALWCELASQEILAKGPKFGFIFIFILNYLYTKIPSAYLRESNKISDLHYNLNIINLEGLFAAHPGSRVLI